MRPMPEVKKRIENATFFVAFVVVSGTNRHRQC